MLQHVLLAKSSDEANTYLVSFTLDPLHRILKELMLHCISNQMSLLSTSFALQQAKQ